MIDELFQKVATLEAQADKWEQYSRRPNLRFHGIEEKEGKDTNAIVIADQKYPSVRGHTLIHVTSSVGRAGIDMQRAGSLNTHQH